MKITPLLMVLAATLAACNRGGGDNNNANAAPLTDNLSTPSAAPGEGLLDRSKFMMTSLKEVNLDRHTATLPLFRGGCKGQTVWYVITDVSDQATAQAIGVNFAPRLASAMAGCPGCVQEVATTSSVLGQANVEFRGGVNFRPNRMLVPGPTQFPPAFAQPGSMGDAMYTPLVRIAGQSVVYNVSIVATGRGPFDVINHTDTHDRVISIDTAKMEVELLFVRAFAQGENIFYFSHEATDAAAATVERATFAPALAGVPFPNATDNPASARAGLWAFVNGPTGAQSPPAQGLNHVIADGENVKSANEGSSVLRTLREGGDAHNVLDVTPVDEDPTRRALYSPLWDVRLAMWTQAAIDQGLRTAIPDANQIRQLAAQGFLTNPGGGTPLGSANIVVNCPVFAFLDEPPQRPRVPRPPAIP